MSETCAKKIAEHAQKMRETTPEEHRKRSRVLEAIAVLEKNKIPASSDNIMLQMGDGGLCRTELLKVISELFMSGYINKNKGNFKVSRSGKTRTQESAPETSSAPSAPHSAGVSIPHDGLPKISSVHSYHSGKTMTYPVGMTGKEEKVIYHPPHLHPRFFHPPPHVMYHPAAPAGVPPGPPFMPPHQVIPVHVPYEHVMEDSTHAPGASTYPVAYYPFLSSPDGKQMQWMFYPMSIPVNAVRPMVSEKHHPKKENETSSNENKREHHETPCSTKTKGPGIVTSDMHQVKPIVIEDSSTRTVINPSQHSSPRSRSGDVHVPFISTCNQGASRFAPNVCTKDDAPFKNKLTEEISSRFAMQPKEAILAKKRKQLLGIVDRVTEVAARKKNRENVRINDMASVVPVSTGDSTTTVSKYGNELMDSYIDEIAMEAAKLRDKQKRERDKPYQRPNAPPRVSLMSKIKDRLDDILKNTEEEKEEKLKEFSSSDAVRDILSSPPEFMSMKLEREDKNKNVSRGTSNTIVIDLENPRETYQHGITKFEHNINYNNEKLDKNNCDDNKIGGNSDEEEPLFNPIDLDKLKNADDFNPNLIVRDVLEEVDKYKTILVTDEEMKDEKKQIKIDNESDHVSSPSKMPNNIEVSRELYKENEPLDKELLENRKSFTVLNKEKTNYEMKKENDESQCENANHNKEQGAELKQYFTRKKLKLKLEELKLKRNMSKNKIVMSAQTERAKRSRTEVYYKEARTNFLHKY